MLSDPSLPRRKVSSAEHRGLPIARKHRTERGGISLIYNTIYYLVVLPSICFNSEGTTIRGTMLFRLRCEMRMNYCWSDR